MCLFLRNCKLFFHPRKQAISCAILVMIVCYILLGYFALMRLENPRMQINKLWLFSNNHQNEAPALNPLILTIANGAFLNFTKNWCLTMDRNGMQDNYIVFCTDMRCYQELVAFKDAAHVRLLTVWENNPILNQNVSEFLQYGSKTYDHYLFQRPRLLRNIYLEYYELFVKAQQNPHPHLHHDHSDHADAMSKRDHGDRAPSSLLWNRDKPFNAILSLDSDMAAVRDFIPLLQSKYWYIDDFNQQTDIYHRIAYKQQYANANNAINTNAINNAQTGQQRRRMFDLLVQYDGDPRRENVYYCGCFLFMPFNRDNHMRMTKFFEIWMDKCAVQEDLLDTSDERVLNDQQLMNEILISDDMKVIDFIWQEVNENEFPTGYLMTQEPNWKETHFASSVHLIHANWLNGYEVKMDFFKENKCWLLDN